MFFVIGLDHRIPDPQFLTVVPIYLPDPVWETNFIVLVRRVWLKLIDGFVQVWRNYLVILKGLWSLFSFVLEDGVMIIRLESYSHLFISLQKLLLLIHWDRPYIVQLVRVKRVLSKRLLLHNVGVVVIFSVLQSFENTLGFPTLVTRVKLIGIQLFLFAFALADWTVLLVIVIWSWLPESILIPICIKRLMYLVIRVTFILREFWVASFPGVGTSHRRLKLFHRDVLRPEVADSVVVLWHVGLHTLFFGVKLLYNWLLPKSQSSCVLYNVWEVRPFHIILLQVFWATLVHVHFDRSLYLWQLHPQLRDRLKLFLLKFAVVVQHAFAFVLVKITSNLVLDLSKVLMANLTLRQKLADSRLNLRRGITPKLFDIASSHCVC